MRRALGVALSADFLLAAGERVAHPWVHPLAPLPTGPGWSDLTPVLEELRRATRPGDGALHVALLPPMTQLRRIELPRLNEDELGAVLWRDAHRYLLDPPATPVVAACPRPVGRKSPLPYLAAFADADLVASVHAAAGQAGFRSTRVLPAHIAWEAGARRHAAVVRQGRGRLIIVGDEYPVQVLVFDGGWIQVCRRAASVDDAIPPGLPAEAAWTGVVTSPAVRERIEAALGAQGGSPASALVDLARFQTPAALAAAGAPFARGWELLPQPLRLERRRRGRILSHRLLAGAAAMLILSAGLELWGAHRELAALQAERRSLRSLVAQAMDVRQTMDGVRERLRALAAAEAGASRWTGVIANVADHLPQDAHLLSFRGQGDSLVLEGVATRAAGAFESLRDAPGVAGVRAEAPIRQEARDSAAPVERFSLGARLAATRPAVGGP